MSKVMIIALALIGSIAQAQIKEYTGPAAKTANPDYSEVYMSNGVVLAENKAFAAAIQGSDVYRCIKQEVAMNKSGKGATLKNIKKNQ